MKRATLHAVAQNHADSLASGIPLMAHGAVYGADVYREAAATPDNCL